jgi:hypothetical protein
MDLDSNGLAPDSPGLGPSAIKIGQNFVAVRCRSWVSLWEGFGSHGKAESDQGPVAEAFSAEFEVVLMRSENVGFAPADSIGRRNTF